jgi:hypothetical protein
MASIQSYRTADSSNKITTYVYKNTSLLVSFDFGSNDIPISDVKNLDYIFITHEHSDHFMGLYNMQYVEALLNSKCEIYASNVTKDLIIAIFENAIRVNLDERSTKKIRELLHKIKGVLFFEKYKLRKDTYFKIFPSGHTYGSSMIYFSCKESKILYTGDIDYASNDSDRQYQLDLADNESVDYVIVDGTYLDSENFKDESFNEIRDSILNKGFNKFYCKPEKIIFFSKKLISSPKLNKKYCIVFTSELKWYLSILKKYNYDPFITDEILLDSSIYALPDNRKQITVSSKKLNKQTNANGIVGLHISFIDLAYMLRQFDPSKTKVLVGHYNDEKKDDILNTFHLSDHTYDFNVQILDDEELPL